VRSLWDFPTDGTFDDTERTPLSIGHDIIWGAIYANAQETQTLLLKLWRRNKKNSGQVLQYDLSQGTQV
jgi:hypothetical protein